MSITISISFSRIDPPCGHSNITDSENWHIKMRGNSMSCSRVKTSRIH